MQYKLKDGEKLENWLPNGSHNGFFTEIFLGLKLIKNGFPMS